MRPVLSTLLFLMALAVPVRADDDGRWEGRRHRHHRERIVVVQPPCRYEREDRWERRHHRRPKVICVVPAREPRLVVGLPLGPRGHVVLKLR